LKFKEVDFSYAFEGKERFRTNVFSSGDAFPAPCG